MHWTALFSSRCCYLTRTRSCRAGLSIWSRWGRKYTRMLLSKLIRSLRCVFKFYIHRYVLEKNNCMSKTKPYGKKRMCDHQLHLNCYSVMYTVCSIQCTLLIEPYSDRATSSILLWPRVICFENINTYNKYMVGWW